MLKNKMMKVKGSLKINKTNVSFVSHYDNKEYIIKNIPSELNIGKHTSGYLIVSLCIGSIHTSYNEKDIIFADILGENEVWLIGSKKELLSKLREIIPVEMKTIEQLQFLSTSEELAELHFALKTKHGIDLEFYQEYIDFIISELYNVKFY